MLIIRSYTELHKGPQAKTESGTCSVRGFTPRCSLREDSISNSLQYKLTYEVVLVTLLSLSINDAHMYPVYAYCTVLIIVGCDCSVKLLNYL